VRGLHLLLVGLIAVAGLVFAAMWLWTIPIISAGTTPPGLMDMQPADMSAEATRTYLATMSDTALRTYLGPQRVLDTVFPIALAAALALATLLLLRPRIGRLALVAALVPMLYLYADLLENAAIADLLRRPNAADAVIEQARVYTQVKFQVLLIAGLILALALFSRLVNWSLERIRRVG
jgi:hypothetical protein